MFSSNKCKIFLELYLTSSSFFEDTLMDSSSSNVTELIIK
nr:MAG TPA: hypothetical protein [Caudoviricetes sp.]